MSEIFPMQNKQIAINYFPFNSLPTKHLAYAAYGPPFDGKIVTSSKCF